MSQSPFQDAPLTFSNAPVVERDGRIYVAHEAAVELASQIAKEDATLLAELALR